MKEQTVANGPATSAPVAPPEIPQAAPAPAPAPKLAPVPEAEPLPKSVAKLKELSVPGGVSDLPESETGALLNDLEKSGASFETEPMPDFDLGSGT
jgi:hypothetical protein